MSYCKNCAMVVEPTGKRHNMCPECGLFVARDKPEAPEEEISKLKEEKQDKKKEKEQSTEPYQITAPKAINLSGREMALAEILINAGLAKNLNDLTKKGLYVMSAMFNMPKGYTMEESNKREEPDPRKLSKELLEQQMLSAYIKNLEHGSGGGQDALQMMMLMRMMDNKSEGKKEDNGFMDKIMQLQMIKSLSGENNNQVASLQRELIDLKRDMQMQQILQSSQQKGTPLQDQIMALEQIRASRDKDMKEMDVKLQGERDKYLAQAMETRVKDVERQMQQAQQGGGLTAQRLQDFKEELKALKEMSHEIGEREKGAGEYISETIGNIAEKAMPALQTMMEQKRQQQMQQPFQQQFQQPPIQASFSEIPPEQYPPVQEFRSDMTETERQMSDTMSDMYIRKKR